jgi:hypothetical protein
MIRLSLLLLFYGSAALAEEPAKVLPLPVIAEGSDATGIAEGASQAKTQEPAKAVNSKDNETAEYQLFDLQPVSVSTYPAGIPSVSRYYLKARLML